MHKIFSIFLIGIMLSSVLASAPMYQNNFSVNPAFAEKGGTEKIVICHIPSGNPNNAHLITVSENSLEAHIAHGDILGNCPQLLAEEYLTLIEKLDGIGNEIDQTIVTQELIDEIQNDLNRVKEIVIELQMIGFDGSAEAEIILGQTVGTVSFFNKDTLEILFEIQIPDETLAIFSAFGMLEEFQDEGVLLDFEEQAIVINSALELVDAITNFNDEEIASTFVLSSIGKFHPSTGNTFVLVVGGIIVTFGTSAILSGINLCLQSAACRAGISIIVNMIWQQTIIPAIETIFEAEALFFEDFTESDAMNFWSGCVGTPFCKKTVATSAFGISPPSAPHWGVVSFIKTPSPFCIGETQEGISKSFVILESGNYEISGTVAANALGRTGLVLVDNQIAFQKTNGNATFSNTLFLDAGGHTVSLVVKVSSSCAGQFPAAFDDIRVGK